MSLSQSRRAIIVLPLRVRSLKGVEEAAQKCFLLSATSKKERLSAASGMHRRNYTSGLKNASAK